MPTSYNYPLGDRSFTWDASRLRVMLGGVNLPPGSAASAWGGIMRIPENGGTVVAYPVTAAGLTAALADASARDMIWIPSCDLTVNITIPANVQIASMGSISKIRGTVQLNDGSTAVDISFEFTDTNAGAISCITGPASGSSIIRNCGVTATNNGAGDAYATNVSGGGDLWVWDCSTYGNAAGGGSGYGIRQSSGNAYTNDDGRHRGSTGPFSGTVQLFSLNEVIHLRQSTITKLYNATDAGLTAALAAAASGDVVRLPDKCSFSGGPWTISAGVEMLGSGENSIITGSVTNNGSMEHLKVVGNVTNAGKMRHCFVSVSSGNGITQTSTAAQIWRCDVEGNTGADYGIHLTGGLLAFTWVYVGTGDGAGVGLYISHANAIIHSCRSAGVIGAQIENAAIVDSCHFRGSTSDGLKHTTGTAFVANSFFIAEDYPTTGYDLNVTGLGLELTNTRFRHNASNGVSLITYGSGDRLSTEGVFNVKDWGAVGDGTTNDTTAVQAALDAASTNGGIAWFPPGTYLCNQLTTYKNVLMKGMNWRASIIKANSSGSLIYYTNNSTGNAWGGGFVELSFDGNSTGTDGLDLSGAYTFIVDQCEIKNFTGSGIKLRGSLIHRIYKSDIHSNAIGIDADFSALGGTLGTVSANLAKVLDCRILHNTSWGIQWKGGAMLDVNGCDLENNGTLGNAATGTIYFQTGPEDLDMGLHVENCWFESMKGGAGIKIDTPDGTNLYHTIEQTLFVHSTDATYGIYVEGATAVNKVSCREVVFSLNDAATADFFANGTNATIFLDNCDGTEGGTGTITGMIHDNIAGEFNALTEKAAPVSGDLVLIEDSEAGYVKRKAQIGNIPGTGEAGADHLHGLARWAADGSSAVFDLPDLAEYIENVFDDGSLIDPSTVTLSSDQSQITLDATPAAASVIVANYVIAEV